MTSAKNTIIKSEKKSSVYAVILAGGVGSRFWPLSRELEPKQFLKFKGEKSLLQQTIDRVLPLIPSENIIIIGSQQHKFELEGQVASFKVPAENIILEPCGKNTAPAIGLAARMIAKRDLDATMIVLPADHYIENTKKLLKIFKQGIEIADKDYLVTIGIEPTSAHTGYGYIKIKKDEGRRTRDEKAYKVEKFTEKPDKKTAKKYFKSKQYFWNSGMFIWRAASILNEINKYLPDLSKKLSLDKWASIQPISIDYGILEKSKKVVMLPGYGLGWSDLGSWSAFSSICDKDKNGNVLCGDSVDFDSSEVSVFGKNRLIATIGLKNTVIVDTDDALLVCDKSRTEDVKKVVDHIKSNKRQEHFVHKTVKRPWGTYMVLNTGLGFKVKLVQISPNKRLSLQRHLQRSEHWVVVEGEAKITVGRDVYYRKSNESIYVPKKGVHRLENATNKPLKIVEVQCGQYLEEDDIERVEDDFQR